MAAQHLPAQPFGRIVDVFGGFDGTWYLCGGWAVDAWLGRETRQHGDIDIAVFEPDQRALHEHLAGWHLVGHDEVLGGSTTQPWDGHDLVLPAHIHARSPLDGEGEWELIVNRRDGGTWLLEPPWFEAGRSGPDDPRIPLALDRAVRELPGGIPAAAPEVLQFFKAVSYSDAPDRYPRPHDEADFAALLPLLDRHAATWLRDAIAIAAPDHPWLERLA